METSGEFFEFNAGTSSQKIKSKGELDAVSQNTPPLPSGEAIQMLTLHIQLNHPQQQQQQGDGGARVGCKAEKVPRPVLKKGQSEDKFLHFSRQWARYKRASNLGSEQQIRDQLLACCSEG